MAEGWQHSYELFRVLLANPRYAVSPSGGVEASLDGRAAHDEANATTLRARLLDNVANYA
jgi:hypothetical protein